MVAGAAGAGATNDTGAVGAAVAICFEALGRPKKIISVINKKYTRSSRRVVSRAATGAAVAAIDDSTCRVGWELVGAFVVFLFGHCQLSSWSLRYCGS